MKKYLDEHSLVNTLKMLRSAHSKHAFLLLEGPTDARFFEKIIDPNSCMIEFPGGTDNAKTKVIAAISRLNTDSFKGVLAVVDADFRRLEQNLPQITNLFFTDENDLEGMLIESPALPALLREYASADKLASFQKRNGPLQKNLRIACKPLGLLRLYNSRHRTGLDFKNLNYKKWLSSNDLEPDVNALVDLVLARSKKSHLKSNVVQEINHGNKIAAKLLCQGHDLVEVLLLALNETVGSKAKLNTETLGKNLRLAFDAIWFAGTELCKAWMNWQETNAPFRVLPFGFPPAPPDLKSIE